MSFRSHRTAVRRGRARTFVQRARFGLLVVVLAFLLAPLGSAQVPSVPLPTPSTTPLGDPTILDIDEGPLTFQGPANSPTRVVVTAPDGTRALSYSLDSEGRARLDVAGENAVADATFLRLEGDPLGDAFTLFLRDATGETHEVRIDRVLLEQFADAADAAGAPDLPDVSDVPLPPAPIEIKRPSTWPGAPTKAYLLYVEDAAKNHLNANQLGGTAFMQKSGAHRAVLQIPASDNEWDRFVVRAHKESDTATMNFTFAQTSATDDAAIFTATFAPSLLGPAEGERILLDVFYEKRLAPILAERFAEPATHRYRVDGIGPSVSIDAPTEADDFTFAVSWAGSDTLSGLGGFSVDYRAAGSPQWTHWLTTPETSATFSGDWGQTYAFRARSLDKVGNPSQEATASTTIVRMAAGENDVNDAPLARLLTPTAGSVLSDVVAVEWQASDPDGTPVTSRVELSDDDGDTWRLIYAGSELRTLWDTTGDIDGSGYRIRLTVSDGTLTASDVASALKVRNVVALPAPGAPDPTSPPTPGAVVPTDATQPGATGDDETLDPASDDEGRKGVPMPALPLVGLALVGAALLLRRR